MVAPRPAKRFDFFGANAKAYNSREPELLLAGPAGTGKAQPLSEPVMTPSGPVPMGQVRVGDVILTPNGGTARVTATHPQGERDVYRVRLSCGRVVRCTADHLWTVRKHVGRSGKGVGVRSESLTLTTQQLMGSLVIGVKTPHRRYWIEAPGPSAMTARPVPVPAYVLGVWLGDGSPVAPGRSFQFTSADPELVEHVRAELGEGHSVHKQNANAYGYVIRHPLRVKPCSYSTRAYIRHNGHSYTLVIRTLNVSRYVGSYPTEEAARQSFHRQPEFTAAPPAGPYKKRLADMGLERCRSHEKFVPELYKNNSFAVRLAVAQGLMDTDGTVNRKTGAPSYCTNSRQLARDFRYLIESLGGGVTICAKRTKCRVAFICHVRFDDPAKLFRLSRKKTLCKPRTKYPFRRWVESIRYEGREECQCITIDSPDRLYLTRGFVPTHNSVVLLTKCLTLLDKYPRCRGLFCRGTRSSLTQSGLVTWEDHVLGPDHPVLVKNPIKRRVRQSYEFDNGSEFIVAGLDDPGKTLSTEYDFVYIQEATEEGIDQDKFMIMKRSLRNPAMPWHQIMMDCNPTSPLSWLFQRSRETGPLKRYNSTHKENPRFFDRSLAAWTPAGIDYIQGTLEGYTGYLRKRFLEGIWAAAEGVVFDAFDPEIHLLPVGFPIPTSWTRVWSIDWGFTSPLVLQFWAVDGDGRMYLYREQYRTGVTAIEMGEWAAMEVREGREPAPRAIVCDHDLLMKEQFEKGFPHCRLELADKVDLLAGIQIVQRRFIVPNGDTRPRIMFVRGAVVKPDQKLTNAGHPASTVDELTAYIWDKNSVKDRPLDKDNHGADGTRYACRWIDSHSLSTANPYGTDYEADTTPELPGDTFR